MGKEQFSSLKKSTHFIHACSQAVFNDVRSTEFAAGFPDGCQNSIFFAADNCIS
jgi:hypothetical protein